MKNVEILLRENVSHLGRVGDIVRVAPGYAHNYLFPKGIAIEATPDNHAAMQRRRARLEAADAAAMADAQARADALSKVALKTRQKADEGGHLYGSVSAASIATLLTSAGYPAAEKDVRLESPIKAVGEFKVPVHVHGDLTAEITVSVEAE